jgi:hypothetical protein
MLMPLTQGVAKQEIALRLHISERTLKARFTMNFSRLGVNLSTEAKAIWRSTPASRTPNRRRRPSRGVRSAIGLFRLESNAAPTSRIPLWRPSSNSNSTRRKAGRRPTPNRPVETAWPKGLLVPQMSPCAAELSDGSWAQAWALASQNFRAPQSLPSLDAQGWYSPLDNSWLRKSQLTAWSIYGTITESHT